MWIPFLKFGPEIRKHDNIAKKRDVSSTVFSYLQDNLQFGCFHFKSYLRTCYSLTTKLVQSLHEHLAAPDLLFLEKNSFFCNIITN